MGTHLGYMYIQDDLDVTLTAFSELLFSSKAICMNFLICKSSKGENVSPQRFFSSLLMHKSCQHQCTICEDTDIHFVLVEMCGPQCRNSIKLLPSEWFPFWYQRH